MNNFIKYPNYSIFEGNQTKNFGGIFMTVSTSTLEDIYKEFQQTFSYGFNPRIETINNLINLLEDTLISWEPSHSDIKKEDFKKALNECYRKKAEKLLLKRSRKGYCLFCRDTNEKTGQVIISKHTDIISEKDFENLKNRYWGDYKSNFLLMDERLVDGFTEDLLNHNRFEILQELKIIELL